MRAPDKIYVASYNGEAFSHSWTMEPLGDITATEYIRKDALLEWLQEKLNWYAGTDFANVYQKFIDKLNSL